MKRRPPPLPRRRVPPRPQVRARRLVRWEREVLAQWEPKLYWYSRRVYRPGVLAWSDEDVKQELRMSVVLACRAFAQADPARPPDAFVAKCLQNTTMSILRLIQAKKRALVTLVPHLNGTTDDEADFFDRQEGPAVSPEAQLECEEDEDGFRGLVYFLRQGITPAQFALLHLRFAEEWEPDVMARIMGLDVKREWLCESCGSRSQKSVARCCTAPTRVRREVGSAKARLRVSASLVRAKAQSIEFLASLGVTTMRDVTTWEEGGADASP